MRELPHRGSASPRHKLMRWQSFVAIITISGSACSGQCLPRALQRADNELAYMDTRTKAWWRVPHSHCYAQPQQKQRHRRQLSARRSFAVKDRTRSLSPVEQPGTALRPATKGCQQAETCLRTKLDQCSVHPPHCAKPCAFIYRSVQSPQKMPQDAKYSPAATVLLVTLNYVFTIAAPPLLALYAAANVEPRYMYTAVGGAVLGWIAYVSIDNCELRTGRPDEAFSKDHWVFSRLRAVWKSNLRRVRPESPRQPPRHRRDACSMAWRCRILTARPNQDGLCIRRTG